MNRFNTIAARHRRPFVSTRQGHAFGSLLGLERRCRRNQLTISPVNDYQVIR